MPRASRSPKLDTFNFRVDAELKSAFAAAADEADRPVAQLLRDFMRGYVEQRARAAFEREARRQSILIAAAEADPDSDGARLQRELDKNFDELMRDEPDY